MLEAPLAAFGVELDDAEFRVHGHERAHAELRGFLHDQIHGVGLRQRLHQREIERATRAAVHAPLQASSIAPRRCTASTLASALDAAAVEHDELIAALEAKHVAEIVRLALVERQAVAIELALDVEARQAVRDNCHGNRRLDERRAADCYIVARMSAAAL